LAAHLIDLQWRVSKPADGDTPPFTRQAVSILRVGTGPRSQHLIVTAVEVELANQLVQVSHLRIEAGQSAVVRNGHHPARTFNNCIGPASVRIPKTRSKNGQPVSLPQRDFQWRKGAALKGLLGPDAAGFSANTVSWQELKRYGMNAPS
jgi:hypothetical protein